MEENKEIKRLLTPRRDIKASETFRNTIKLHIQERSDSSNLLKLLWGTLTIGTAAAILILLMLPSRLSAKALLADAISSFRPSSCLEMKVDIRTDSIEIFSFINHEAEFVRHDILLQRNDSSTYWYITKGKRSAVKNPDGLYVWIEPYALGWHYTDGNCNILGYLDVLMHPEDILESEFKAISSEPKTTYDLTKNKDDIILTLHSMPMGNFANPYRLNTSVLESENVRRYVFDSKTHRLKSSTVSIVIEGDEIEILKVTDINYGKTDRSLPQPPADITFIANPESTTPGIPGLDARETASVLLNALAEWNTEIIYRFLNPVEADEVYRRTYEGAKLLWLGSPFCSGSNTNLIFVPYTLRLKDGYVKKMNLALSCYDKGTWLFDGGL